jgi:hypothetical protein
VDSGNSHAAIIIEPNYYPTSAWVNTAVIRAGNRIALTATGDEGKPFKRSCGEILAHIGGHKIKLVNLTPPSNASVAWLNLNILGECLKAYSVLLFNCDSDMTRLAGFDIVHCSGFAGMCAAYDATKRAVL